MAMKVLRHGFDTIDVSFSGVLPEGVLESIAAAKEAAINQQFDEPLEIGGIVGMVGQTGKRGGYRYTFNTGPEGEIWWIKHKSELHADPDHNHNIFVSVSAAQLLLKGWKRVRDDLYVTLEKMGATILGESLNRVDFAIDILAPDFVLVPEKFVHAWQATKKTHKTFEAEKTEEDEEDEKVEKVNYVGRKCNAVTIGEMPGRQLIVYDKRREVINARGKKDYWWDAWGLNKENPENKVWRVEIRAGKKYLKGQWGMSTWQDFEDSILDVFMDTLESIRYVVPTGDSNASRWPNDPLWDEVSQITRSALSEHESGLVKGRVTDITRQNAVTQYMGQIRGLMAGYSVALGEFDTEKLSKILADMMLSEGETLDFARKQRKVQRRLFFIDKERNKADLGLLYRQFRERCMQYSMDFAAKDVPVMECPY